MDFGDRFWCVAAAMCITLGGVQAATSATSRSQTPTVRPEGPAQQVVPPFAVGKEKVRQSVSGMACAPEGGYQHCLLVFDEGTKAHMARMGPKQLEPVGTVIELADGAGELDTEAAAFSDGIFYVTGSHSVKRESCKENEASRVLIKFKAVLTAGSPARINVSDKVQTRQVWDLMLKDPYLRNHVNGCLGDGKGGNDTQMKRRPGVNIEGLAVARERLYFGFRAPSEDGKVPIFSVDLKAVFEDGSDAKPKLERLSLGQQLGIRDMVATHDAILLLVGPDDHEQSLPTTKWKIFEWIPAEFSKQASSVRLLAELDAGKSDIGNTCVKDLKPEALAVLNETSQQYRIIVLSDGVCDGGPLIFNIPR